MLLKDPLDQFEDNEALQIINYLTQDKHQWSLVVVSKNKAWQSKCSRILTLDKGQIQ